MQERPDLKAVSDDKLLRGLFEILKKTRHDEADLIDHIAEVDARKLYARQATPSMFVWCTEVLHLSEQEAYLRIAVARASREHPMLLTMLRDGRLHLSGIARLVPHLTRENRDAILKRAAGMSHRQIKELVSELEPKPDAPTRIRKLPDRPARTSATEPAQLCAHIVGSPTNEPRPAEEALPGRASETPPVLDLRPAAATPPPAKRPSLEPLSPARFKVQFTADAEFRDELERLQALTRTAVPDGDLGKVIRLAVKRELERLEAKRFAKMKKPRKRLAQTDTRPRSRHIPAAVRRFVEKRDGGRCSYRDRHGRRCSKRHDLEFHHRKPFGRGGDHSPANVALACETHNALLAERDYGKEAMARHRRSGSRVSEPPAVTGSGRRSAKRGPSSGEPLLTTPSTRPKDGEYLFSDRTRYGVVRRTS
jgi:5-methylcytosine-specific restriction endonuclease McrA